MQKIIPAAVGRAAASAVHLRLPVSFFTVSSVVEHGQCISANMIKHTAVKVFQPFDMNSSRIADTEESSVSEPADI